MTERQKIAWRAQTISPGSLSTVRLPNFLACRRHGSRPNSGSGLAYPKEQLPCPTGCVILNSGCETAIADWTSCSALCSLWRSAPLVVSVTIYAAAPWNSQTYLTRLWRSGLSSPTRPVRQTTENARMAEGALIPQPIPAAELSHSGRTSDADMVKGYIREADRWGRGREVGRCASSRLHSYQSDGRQ